MRSISICDGCRLEVLWTITEGGKRLAVDPTPDPGRGNTAVYRDGTGTRRSRRPTDEMPLMGWERLHVPHIATCGTRQSAPAPTRPGTLPVGVSDLSAHRRRTRGRS